MLPSLGWVFLPSSLRLRFPFYLGPLSPVYLLVATQGLAAYSCFITQSFWYFLKDLLAQLSASISSLVVWLYAEFKHKSYENDVFIASAISNIFQNYNYCSLEMEQLSLDISIAKICLLNYFINCWWLSYRQNMHLRKKKGKQIWKLSKIVYNVYLEGHFHLWIKILSIIN